MGNQQSTHPNIFTIDELLVKMELALEKASYMQSELTDGFFGKPNHLKDKEVQTSIIWDYNRHGIFAEIVEDNICAAKEILALIYDLNKEAIVND